MEDTMRELLLFGLMFAAVLVVIGAMVGYSKLLDWNEQRKAAVKSSRIGSATVMSQAEDAPSPSAASALETDTRQTTDRRMIPVPTDQEMLDIFRVMRAAGIKRETISGVWRAAGLPLNNNLWSKAEPLPPELPPEKAPISGRSIPPGTKFYQDDPELEYRPL